MFEFLVDFPIPEFEVLLISTGVARLKVVKEKKRYLTFCMWQPYKRYILTTFSVNFVQISTPTIEKGCGRIKYVI